MKEQRNKNIIFIKVIQNGAEIAAAEILSTKKNVIRLTSGKGILSLPLNIISEDITLLSIHHKKIFLTLDRPWDGYLTSKGQDILIGSHGCDVKAAELQANDYANLVLAGLRVMIKVVPFSKSRSISLNPAYKGRGISLFISTQEEKRAWLYGAIISASLFFTLWCLSFVAPPKHKISFEDLEDVFVLPFLHETSLETSPEALQKNLDRSQWLVSVIRYYRNISAMLMGGDRQNDYGLFPSSVKLYEALFAEQQKKIEEAVVAQEQINQKQRSSPEAAMPVIPAVQGESFRQKLLRLTQKIGTMHHSFNRSLEVRHQTNKEFRKIPDYQWGDYQNKTQEENSSPPAMQGAEELSKITVFKQQTNEEQMYAQARMLAGKAAQIQRYLSSRSEPDESLKNSGSHEIGIPSGVGYVSFIGKAEISGKGELRLEDVRGLTIGKPKQRPKEPLIGQINPRLIEKVLKKHRFQINLCYELALRRDQNLRGKMSLVWKIDSRGRVYDVSLAETTLKDRQMIRCIRKKLVSWQFPSPGKGSVQINHSFEFEPQGG